MSGRLVWNLANSLYRSRRAARFLFGVDVSPLGPDDHYFDVTTWVLLQRASREVTPDAHVVDLGAGSQAIVGLALWRRHGCRVTAIELHPELVARARANALRNRAPIAVIESHFFEALSGEFDLAVFNPPYIPTLQGEIHGLPEERRSQWDGGEDGLVTVRDFLQAIGDRRHALRVLLGVNSMHVDLPTLRRHIAGCVDLVLEQEFFHPILPVAVYSLAKAKD